MEIYIICINIWVDVILMYKHYVVLYILYYGPSSTHVDIRFSFLSCDSAVLIIWSGLGTETTWLW